MSAVTAIAKENVEHVLRSLLDREVTILSGERRLRLHEATLRGLVTDADELVGAIGCDADFARLTGAALAMIPAGGIDDDDEELIDEELLEFYQEVANVLSRVVNEASPERVRIDPGMEHAVPTMLDVLDGASGVAVSVDIEGYGQGTVGLWSRL